MRRFPWVGFAVVGLTLLSGTSNLVADGSFREAGIDRDVHGGPVRAFDFPDDDLAVSLGWVPDEDDAIIRCTARAMSEGAPKGNIRFTLVGELLDDDGNVIFALPVPLPRRTRVNRGGYASWDLDLPREVIGREALGREFLIEGTGGTLHADFEVSGNATLDKAWVGCTAGQAETCTPDSETICLFGDRFEVAMDWIDPFDATDQTGVVKRNGFAAGTFARPGLGTAGDVRIEAKNRCRDTNNPGFYLSIFAADVTTQMVINYTDMATGDRRRVQSQAKTPSPFAPLNNPVIMNCP